MNGAPALGAEQAELTDGGEQQTGAAASQPPASQGAGAGQPPTSQQLATGAMLTPAAQRTQGAMGTPGANGTPPALPLRSAVEAMQLGDDGAGGSGTGTGSGAGAMVAMETIKETVAIAPEVSTIFGGLRMDLEYQRPVGDDLYSRKYRLEKMREYVARLMAPSPKMSPADQLESYKQVSAPVGRPTYKVQPPQCFSGQQPGQGDRQAIMKVADELETFLAAMPEYLRLTHTPARDWALLAATYLRGAAQGYYRALLGAQGASFHPDWDWFCNALRSHFISPAQSAYVTYNHFGHKWAAGVTTYLGLKGAEEVSWQKVQAALGPDFFGQGTARIWTFVRAAVAMAALPPRALELVLTNEDLKPHSDLPSLLRMMEKRATAVNEALAAATAGGSNGGKRQRNEQEQKHDGASTSGQQQPARQQTAREVRCHACHGPGHYVDSCPDEKAKAAYLAANPNYGAKVRGPGGRFGDAGGRGSGSASGRFGGREGRGFGRGRGSMQNGSMAAAPAALPPANQ